MNTRNAPFVVPIACLAPVALLGLSCAGSPNAAKDDASAADQGGSDTATDGHDGDTGSDSDTGSDTTGSDTTGSDTTGSDTTGSDTTSSDTTGSDTTGDDDSDSDDGTGDDTGDDGEDCPGPTPGTSGTNPLFTEIFTADPAVLVHDCTVYITAGHDEGTNGFLLRDWYVLSSTNDMVDWSYNDGPVLSLDDFAWANANAWASQMVEKDGKFYWYVPINATGDAMTIGVAVADHPLGPFTDAIGGPLIDDAFEMENMGFNAPPETPYTIDPTVLVDDDGAAYLLYGGFSRMVTARLGDDMISIEGTMEERTPPSFFEAPYLIKRDDTYYVIYASGINPAGIDYVTSSSPLGPWTVGGRILDPLPNHPGQDAATSHPAVVEFAGQWYLVYHLSDGAGGGTYRRQVAVDKLFFNPDGSIQKVTPSDGLTF